MSINCTKCFRVLEGSRQHCDGGCSIKLAQAENLEPRFSKHFAEGLREALENGTEQPGESGIAWITEAIY